MKLSHILFSNVATEFAKLGLGPVTMSLAFPEYPENESYALSLGEITLSVHCNGYGNKGRASIGYSRPRTKKGEHVEVYVNNGKVVDPSITVSLEKSAEGIAKDITRRLLPEAKRVDALVKVRILESDNFVDNKTALINEVAEALGTKPEVHYSTKEITGKVDPYVGVKPFGSFGYGHFTVNGPDSISLELHSMGKDFGLEVVKAIRDLIVMKITTT